MTKEEWDRIMKIKVLGQPLPTVLAISSIALLVVGVFVIWGVKVEESGAATTTAS